MEQEAHQRLKALVEAYGTGLWMDHRRLEALLRDAIPDSRKEIHALVLAARERVPSDLQRQQVPPAMLERRLSDLGLAADVARWAVDTWALALAPPPGSAPRMPRDGFKTYIPGMETYVSPQPRVLPLANVQPAFAAPLGPAAEAGHAAQPVAGAPAHKAGDGLLRTAFVPSASNPLVKVAAGLCVAGLLLSPFSTVEPLSGLLVLAAVLLLGANVFRWLPAGDRPARYALPSFFLLLVKIPYFAAGTGWFALMFAVVLDGKDSLKPGFGALLLLLLLPCLCCALVGAYVARPANSKFGILIQTFSFILALLLVFLIILALIGLLTHH